ncbi:MAG: hypothetical protein WC666_03490 [Candidatus Paceibacterota bacterium]|jgi:DNA polymerase III delta subunit
MLYILHGSNISKSVEKAHSLINSLRAKKPDATFVKLSSEDWSTSVIEEHLGGQGLFSNKYIILLDRVTENSEAKDQLPEFIEAMHESTNIFIVCEGKLNVELKKIFEKYAEKVVVSDEPVKAFSYGKATSGGANGKKDFNIFALADAFGSRDKMKAWMIYREAIKNGLESESILGTLFWQAKSMALAVNCKSANEASLKPFVFDKSKRYAKNFSKEELDNLLKNIIILYHDGHRGVIDLELATEKMMLKI